MAILDYSEEVWRSELDLPSGAEPSALILEGTWWRETATRNRLGLLDNVRELRFPDMFIGEVNGTTVAYCCAYGAARAVEPAHVFAQLGTPLLIQIGTCGILDAAIRPGTVVLPEICEAREGIATLYGADSRVTPSPHWLDRADAVLRAAELPTTRTHHLTWPSLFAQSNAMCDDWSREGIVSIDMEAATVVAVADHFGVSAIAMLCAWDALDHDKTFLDPLDDADTARLTRSNQHVFEAALTLAQEAASNHSPQ